MAEIIEKLKNYLQLKHTKDLSIYDESFLERCIQIRKTSVGLNSVHDYVEFLRNNTQEAHAFLKSLSNSYSEFFRDPLTFSLLEQTILPAIADGKTKCGSQEVRIWSAGCSAGQEAYSLAVLAAEFNKLQPQKISFRIFATDISQKELDAAASGVYDLNALRRVRLEHLSSYFTKEGSYYIIRPELRQYIDFSYYDLLDEYSASPPQSIYGEFDIIFCSNVMIYYNNENRIKIVSKLKNALSERGLLITGDAETGILKSQKGLRQSGFETAIFERI